MGQTKRGPQFEVEELSSGDPLFTFDGELEIVTWNPAAEALTGVPAGEAVGRRCWQVLGGSEVTGAVVCHAGCSYARLAREGWPIPLREVTIRTGEGPRRVLLSTIALRGRESGSLTAHVMFDSEKLPLGEPDEPPHEPLRRPSLTPRQQEVLALLSEGVPAKVIARRLGVSETTVRNHIRAVLLELECHSQLAAVAKGRRLGLV